MGSTGPPDQGTISAPGEGAETGDRNNHEPRSEVGAVRARRPQHVPCVPGVLSRWKLSLSLFVYTTGRERKAGVGANWREIRLCGGDETQTPLSVNGPMGQKAGDLLASPKPCGVPVAGRGHGRCQKQCRVHVSSLPGFPSAFRRPRRRLQSQQPGVGHRLSLQPSANQAVVDRRAACRA